MTGYVLSQLQICNKKQLNSMKHDYRNEINTRWHPSKVGKCSDLWSNRAKRRASSIEEKGSDPFFFSKSLSFEPLFPYFCFFLGFTSRACCDATSRRDEDSSSSEFTAESTTLEEE